MPEKQQSPNAEFISYRKEVLAQLNKNASAATKAAGLKAVDLILKQMRSGYGKPIRQTGDLMRDVNYQVLKKNTVNVGNSLEYAPYVHEGTSKMKGRPYITDALMKGKKEITDIYNEYLKKGF